MSWLKRLASSKWLPWLGVMPFLYFALVPLMDGDAKKSIGTLAFFASAFVAIPLGAKIGGWIGNKTSALEDKKESSLSSSGAAFLFLFLPVVIGKISNIHLGTEIEMYSITTHLLWALLVAGAVFFLPFELEKSER